MEGWLLKAQGGRRRSLTSVAGSFLPNRWDRRLFVLGAGSNQLVYYKAEVSRCAPRHAIRPAPPCHGAGRRT
eukprot:6211324-Prymnesium_polylepis.2